MRNNCHPAPPDSEVSFEEWWEKQTIDPRDEQSWQLAQEAWNAAKEIGEMTRNEFEEKVSKYCYSLDNSDHDEFYGTDREMTEYVLARFTEFLYPNPRIFLNDILSDPNKAKDFLKRAGLIEFDPNTGDYELAKEYR